jgi:glycosyltransferase involved in cell wall biosynthesis
MLYVGTLEPRKNLSTLLRAYACLPQRDRVKLVLAGGRGWQMAQTLGLIEAWGLAQDVILPGYISHDMLPLWYNAADIFVYPSLYEGFGLPLLEAMACGVPVIASDTTSLPEAVGPDGLLVPPEDVGAWADTMHRLLDHEDLRAALAERGRERAKTFTWQNTARQTVAAYHRALQN